MPRISGRFFMGRMCSDVESCLLEDKSAAYIVRVWLEPREIEGAPVEWRGSIEHVASGTTKYLTDLDEMPRFIRPFLEAMGVDFGEITE